MAINRALQTLLLSTLLAVPAAAAPQVADPEVALNVADGRWVPDSQKLEVRIAGELRRAAVLIDQTDWTGLFARNGNTLTYEPVLLRLPSGEHSLSVHAIDGDGAWRELLRVPLRVLTPRGYQRVQALPSFDVSSKGQVAAERSGAAPAFPRETYQDVTANAALRSQVVRGRWTTATEAAIVGVSNREEALRFAERQDAAPLVDLSSYLFRAENHAAAVSLGHISFGAHRHLAKAFASRGATGTLKFGSRADLALAALNGSSIVGWNNFLGVQRQNHRLFAGTFGVELLDRTPGLLRAELTGLRGRVLPTNGVTDASINDAERSYGLGARLLSGTASQRWKLDAGYAQSTFGNPADPLLSGSAALIPVRDESRRSRYVDASLAVLRKPLANNALASITLGYRHEQIDPQFASVASELRADLQQDAVDLTAAYGAATVQVTYTRAHDNLDEIDSILSTATRVVALSAAVPLAAVTGTAGKPSPWVPALTYQLNRTHQFGESVPVNSDFLSASQIPDQKSTNHLAGLQWQFSIVQAGYQFNRSFQDNRQPGRERADLLNLTNTVTISLTPHPRVSGGADFGFEGAENRESIQRDVTRRLGLNGRVRLTARTTLSGAFAGTRLRDDGRTRRTRATDLNLELAQTFPLSKRVARKPQAQAFLRFARQSGSMFESLFGVDMRQRTWTLNSGLTVSLF